MTAPPCLGDPDDDAPGRHWLRPEDEDTRRDAVRLYGEVTNFVMPLPYRTAPPRHWNGLVA